jgi:murein DD-endopeptidase MepM/ murein hydrolase activator NlpD
MRRSIYPLVCYGLLMLAFCGNFLGSAATPDDLDRRIDQTQKKLVDTRIKEYSATTRLLKTQQQLDRIGTNLNQINSKLGNTDRNIAEINRQLGIIEGELDSLNAGILSRRQTLNNRLVSVYKYGYQSYFEALLQARSFSEFVSRFEMVGEFVRDDVNLIQTLKKQQALIAQKRQEIALKQQDLEVQRGAYSRLQNQAKNEQTRWDATARDQQQQLAAIQKDRRQLEQALDELERLSKQMESQIRGLQSKNHTALGTGNLIWPTQGTITSKFGNRYHPILRRYRYHSGVDIAAPQGTPIFAADNGFVIFSDYNGGYGKMIIIDHGNGISTVYGHCSTLLVGAGQTVSKAQNIAQMGSTGLSTGSHLHFEVRKDGVPQDPMQHLH